jgi:pimeloyl-ACP methyl ester carboxylesterase
MLPFLASLLGKKSVGPPAVNQNRDSGNQAAIVFIHGYSGRVGATFKSFIELLLNDPYLKSWDIYDVGYPTGMSVDIPGLWAADPDLKLCATGLVTRLNHPPLSKYEAIVLVAHSMGGLVVQRALLDAPELAGKVRHVLLYGSPSGGLQKAQFARSLKFQVRDMAQDGEFIRTLRSEWNARFSQPPFQLTLVQGDMDQFVSAASSLQPFETGKKEVVPGNHLEIVRPTKTSDLSYQILSQSILGDGRVPSVVDSARLAVEHGHFAQAVDALLPQVTELDDQALVTLALALEETGRGVEAADILRAHHTGGSDSTDVLGVLAGRLKREWLVKRRKANWEESCRLYEMGLQAAEGAGNWDQAAYHAINLAFLNLMNSVEGLPVPPAALEFARRAAAFCQKSPASAWQLFTLGEAHLILGNLEEGAGHYQNALASAVSPREISSAYSQAQRVAGRVYGRKGLARIEKVFGA